MKELLRREMLLKRSGQSPEAIAEKSKAVGERLLAMPEWHKAKTLMLYASTRSEVQTRTLMESALAQGKRVCLPVRNEEGAAMDAYFLASPNELVMGDLGFFEPPKKENERAEPSLLDLVILPGIAFDENGNRLGRGMHYYDLFLPKVRCRKIALAFEMQLVAQVPVEDHDMPVDKIVTEKRIINCARQ